MKCIRCEHDSTYKERGGRGGGRCPGCGKPFAFEPREGAWISDMGFKRALDVVSADGHVQWGVEHLYYELCRRFWRSGRTRRRAAWIVAALATVVTIAAVAKGTWRLAVPAAALAVVIVTRTMKGRRMVPLGREDFEPLWQRWSEVHRDRTKGVIVRKEQPAPARRAAEPDIGLYSFDRAVVCDRARTVDLLLANNFHFENNCAVLSIDGYSAAPFAIVRAMLKRNPRLHVFALHDATPGGCRLAHRLASDSEWFKGQATIVDVGLRPAHAKAFSGLLLPAHGARLQAGPGITEEEAAWLSLYSLELAAIRPEQVLKRLYRAISNKPESTRRRDGSSDGDSGSGGSDSSSGDRSGTAQAAMMAATEGQFGGAGASGGWTGSDVFVDTDAFSSDAGDADGDGDGSG